MSAEADLGGQKVPQHEWEATPGCVQERVKNLIKQNQHLNDCVNELEEHQRRNFKNSSQPPSKDNPEKKSTGVKQPLAWVSLPSLYFPSHRQLKLFKPRLPPQPRTLTQNLSCA